MRQRPVSTLIFGILNIAFGVWKMLGPLLVKVAALIKLPGKAGASFASDPSYAKWVAFNAWLGFAFGVALVVCGIGLLMLHNWGRIASIAYSALEIVKSVVVGIVGYPIMERQVSEQMQRAAHVPPGAVEGLMMFGVIVGIVISLIYPSLLIFFMTRSNVIEACQVEQVTATA